MELGDIAILVAVAALSLNFVVSTISYSLTRRVLLAASLGSASMLLFSLIIAAYSEYASLLRPCDSMLFRTFLVSAPSLAVVASMELVAHMRGLEQKIPLPTSPMPLLALTLLVLAPVSEELVFRGFLLYPTMESLGPLAALLVTSAVFAALHSSMMPKEALPAIFAVGAILGLSVIRWGSLLPSMVSHSVLNLQGLLLLWRLGRGEGSGSLAHDELGEGDIHYSFGGPG